MSSHFTRSGGGNGSVWLVLFLTLALAACGGSSDGSAGDPAPNNPPTNDSGDDNGDENDDGGDSDGDSGESENLAPAADAGADQSVDDGALVTLDGAASTDADGDTLAWHWVQDAGPAVTLSADNVSQPTFTAPAVSGGTALAFTLTVTDSEGASSTDSVSITVNDVTPASATFSEGVGEPDAIVITFDETVDPASLVLGGSLAALGDSGSWSSTTNVNDTLTLTPTSRWAFGEQDLDIDVTDLFGNASDLSLTFKVYRKFVTGQSASVVIGQADFDNGQANRNVFGGTTAAGTLHTPLGNVAYDATNDLLFVPDQGNSRVLAFDGIPSTHGVDAIFAVGETSLTSTTYGTSNTSLYYPIGAVVAADMLFVPDAFNARVAIYDPTPVAGPGTIATVVGQADKDTVTTACSATQFQQAQGTSVTPDGKLLVVTSDNRVLIWNSVPATDGVAADLVLGQQDFTHCVADDSNGDGVHDGTAANTLRGPLAVWSDGTRVVVNDTQNNRVLIWNSFPTVNGQPADVVLGQSAFNMNDPNDDNQDGGWEALPSARTLQIPQRGLYSNGIQLFVTDGNNRVLIWNTFPTENFTPADVVIGQADFTSASQNAGNGPSTPGADGLYSPDGVYEVNGKLFVTDMGNSRVLIFDAQ